MTVYLDQEAATISRPVLRKKSVESYAHKAAKAVFTGWLREAAEEAGHDNYAKLGRISWRVNREGPMWGIYEEYPIASKNDAGWGDDVVWDEAGWEAQLDGMRFHGDIKYASALNNIGHCTFRRIRACTPPSPYMWMEMERIWEWCPRLNSNPPTYAQCLELGIVPKVILDIAVQHKGCITHGIEIVHRHGITDEKRAFLRSTNITTVVVEADWILRQIERPRDLQPIEVIGYW